MFRIKVNDETYSLLSIRAQREGIKIEDLINKLLRMAMWNEPSAIFKGRHCQINPEMFDTDRTADIVFYSEVLKNE